MKQPGAPLDGLSPARRPDKDSGRAVPAGRPGASRREPSATRAAAQPPSADQANDTAPLVVEITGLNSQGQGVARSDGLVIFVDNAVPGDRVAVQLQERHRQYAVGRISEILATSKDRRQPFCPVADRCGGCSLQAMDYPAQLLWKQRQVADLVLHQARLAHAPGLVLPVLGMANPCHYRSKVQFPVGGTTDRPQIGFYERRSHRIVDTDRCDIQHPVADRIRAAVRQYIRQYQVLPYQEQHRRGLLRHLVVRIGENTGQVMVILVATHDALPATDALPALLQQALAGLPPGRTGQAWQLASLYLNLNPGQTNVILGSQCRLLAGATAIEEILLGLRLRISPLSFFQVNPQQTEVLYRAVLAAAGLSKDQTVLDLYCGTGSISLALAREAGRVVGVEVVPDAIADARINAAVNRLTNVEFIVAQAETWLPAQTWPDNAQPAVAVVDPPRKGCDQALLDALRRMPLRRIVYVSCNPATLARDIGRLQPDFALRQIQPVDMFPWSDAVECVATLERP